jgi:hypothetical protein
VSTESIRFDSVDAKEAAPERHDLSLDLLSTHYSVPIQAYGQNPMAQ